MGEFENAARSIADAILEKMASGKKVSPDEIDGILKQRLGEINCYPGRSGHRCHRVAFFVSLKNKNYATGRGHLDFSTVLRLLVKHIQGNCPDITRYAVIVTDSWDDSVYWEWRANIENIKRSCLVEAYLITGGKVTSIAL